MVFTSKTDEWEVEYSHEAANYLNDNGQLVANLFFAMESLSITTGIPTEGIFREKQGLYHWTILNHLVIYLRIEVRQSIRIVVIKPL